MTTQAELPVEQLPVIPTPTPPESCLRWIEAFGDCA